MGINGCIHHCIHESRVIQNGAGRVRVTGTAEAGCCSPGFKSAITVDFDTFEKCEQHLGRVDTLGFDFEKISV
jgi:hypothetical protein